MSRSGASFHFELDSGGGAGGSGSVRITPFSVVEVQANVAVGVGATNIFSAQQPGFSYWALLQNLNTAGQSITWGFGTVAGAFLTHTLYPGDNVEIVNFNIGIAASASAANAFLWTQILGTTGF